MEAAITKLDLSRFCANDLDERDYLHTPWRDQRELPNFDSAPLDFNATTMFENNSFSGVDRVADAHLVTAGLTSRLIDAGSGAGTAPGSGAGGRGGRSLEEIQLGFDRGKAGLNAIFSRAAREMVGMGAGRIMLSLTIAPDGSVTRCELVSSSFANPALEQKLLARIRQMNFGPRDVPPFTVMTYPLDYLPG